MKIVYFLEGTFNSGGIERIVIGKANRLASKGYDVTIVTTDQKGRPDFFPLIGVKRIDFDLNYRDKTNNIIKDYFKRRNLIKKETKLIENLVNELKPDVMVSTFRYENHILPKLKDKSRKIVEIHFSKYYRLHRNRKGIYRLIDKYLTREDQKQAKKFDSFVCLTEEDKSHWKGLQNIEVINNFIEARTVEPAHLENKSAIAVGRLTFQKGFDRLIDSWKLVHDKYPDWELNIFGDGPLKNKLQEQIRQAGLKDVIHIHQPIPDIHKKYLENSFLLLTSHYEGLPMVMLEAMEAGLPLVSFNFKCGPKDIIDDGVNGFIIKDGDIHGMANAICRLIESPALRKQLGENAFEKAKDFLPEKIMPKWENIFGQPRN